MNKILMTGRLLNSLAKYDDSRPVNSVGKLVKFYVKLAKRIDGVIRSHQCSHCGPPHDVI